MYYARNVYTNMLFKSSGLKTVNYIPLLQKKVHGL